MPHRRNDHKPTFLYSGRARDAAVESLKNAVWPNVPHSYLTICKKYLYLPNCPGIYQNRCYNHSLQLHHHPFHMAEIPQSDVSRPSALPTANLQRNTGSQSLVDQNSSEYLDAIEEEWNKKVDAEVEILVDGMVDLVSLASVKKNHEFTCGEWICWLGNDHRLGTRINFVLRRNHFKRNRVQNRWWESPLYMHLPRSLIALQS